QQRACVADEAGLRAGRYLDRPGRLLRGFEADDARRPDVPGAPVGVLLRGEHAGRGAAYLDLRSDQRDHALCDRDREPRLAGRAQPRQVLRPRAERPRWRGDLPAGRRGARARLDAGSRCASLGAADREEARLTTVAGAVRRYLDHLTVERGLAAHTIE